MHRRTSLTVFACGMLAGCIPEVPAPQSDENAPEAELRVVHQSLDGGTDGAVNTPPNPQDDAVTVDEDDTVEIDVLGNDVDPDGDPLTVFISENASEGMLIAGDGTFVYSPRANFSGTDSFIYGVLDGRGGSAEATVEITVVPVNDPPVFIAPTPPNFGTIESSVGVALEFQMAAADIESDPLTFGFDDFGAAAEPSVSGTNFQWTPDPEDVGLHDVTIFVTDGTDRTERQLTFDVSDSPGGPEACGTDRCEDDETCVEQECVPTCATAADCDTGQRCSDGLCVEDPCLGITCPDGESCAAGRCFAGCDAAADCAANLNCYAGRCAEAPCDGVSCAPGESCFAGRCGTTCTGDDTCEADTTCYVGVCLGDTEGFCEDVSCRSGSTCAGGLCTVCEGGTCGGEGPQFEDGGCGCTQSGAPGGAALVVLLLAGLAAIRNIAHH